MRTTLAIDDDILAAARNLAQTQGKSLGAVISALARHGLQPKKAQPAKRNGVPLLPIQAGSLPVTLEVVNRLRDELE
ncbi:MAG: CopG family transcriptional regulator [Pseudomonadota bacterium]